MGTFPYRRRGGGWICKPKAERNVALLKDWLAGVPRKRIAEKYDISEARVTQIAAHASQMRHLPWKLRYTMARKRGEPWPWALK
jgi:hypothetical protein